MKLSRRFFAVAVASIFTTASFADVTWFSGRDIVADFENFTGLSGDFQKTLAGKTPEGTECKIALTKKGKKLTIQPGIQVKGLSGDFTNNELAKSSAFIVTNDNKDFNGGFEDNKLWASYFIDRKSSLMIHGQFGVSFSLDIEKNAQGKLTKIRFSKTRQEDLGFYRLGSVDCTLAP